MEIFVLSFANALQNHLFGSLRGDTIKNGGRINVHCLTKGRMWVQTLCLCQRNLITWFDYLCYNAFLSPHPHLSVFIDLDADVLSTSEALAVGCEQCIGHGFHYYFAG